MKYRTIGPVVSASVNEIRVGGVSEFGVSGPNYAHGIEGRQATIRTAWGVYRVTAAPGSNVEAEYTPVEGEKPVAGKIGIKAPHGEFVVEVGDDGEPVTVDAAMSGLGADDGTESDGNCPQLNTKPATTACASRATPTAPTGWRRE